MIVIPNSRTTPADITNINELANNLEHHADHLGRIVDHVAKARQIKEYDGERRKACLAKAMSKLLTDGTSAAAAEQHARASTEYVDAMRLLGRDLYEAEKMLLDYEVTKIKLEATRSLLSVHRALISELT